MVLLHSIKTGKISLTSAVIKMTLVWMPSYTFFAMSHGKGACNRIDRTIKMLARKASLMKHLEGADHTTTTLPVSCCKDSISHLQVL
jgi:hypothetical protein